MPEYSFGWVPSPPDHRDHIFRSSMGPLSLPDSVLLVAPPLPAPFEPAWNQGRLGSCGPHSEGKDIVFAQLRQDKRERAIMPSRLFMYYTTRMLMNTVNQDSGVNNRAMLKALAQYGWCSEELWPYDVSKFRDRPPAGCFAQAATRKITEYLSVPQSLDQMRGCLAQGDPFIFGFSCYESLQSDAVARTGDIPMPGRNERQVGGHDVLIVGYDDSTRKFKLVNSWGDWGQGGYGTISYEYATHPRLASDFWTVRHSALKDDVPPPPPARTRTITIAGDARILIDGKEV